MKWSIAPADPVSLGNSRVPENDFLRLLSEKPSVYAVSEEKPARIAVKWCTIKIHQRSSQLFSSLTSMG